MWAPVGGWMHYWVIEREELDSVPRRSWTPNLWISWRDLFRCAVFTGFVRYNSLVTIFSFFAIIDIFCSQPILFDQQSWKAAARSQKWVNRVDLLRKGLKWDTIPIIKSSSFRPYTLMHTQALTHTYTHTHTPLHAHSNWLTTRTPTLMHISTFTKIRTHTHP